MNRRSFGQIAVAAVSAGAAASHAAAAESFSWTGKKMIGIQVGAVSFVDEGVDPVLDNLQKLRRLIRCLLQHSLMAAVLPAGRFRVSPCRITASRNTTRIFVAATTRKSIRSSIGTLR